MDELLDVMDIAADAGLEGALTWLFRLVGLLAILAGIALFVVTDVTVLVPAALVVVGLLLVIVPGILVQVAEVAG
ncbi:hypothetical protein [Halosegnis longus]|uniref:Uncharacterized protein n=1 Tax=Halosegnis longus TaxID=2216012 RepID=A0AAJ4RA57_9EURY|nr:MULTISPECIES: hypothetical protein [Halobacteriales]RNJ26981.1 hypothetical protein Nmn1133_09995 [Salella cibi]